MPVVLCPSSAELEQLFLGDLPEEQAQAREAHVLGCACCLEKLQALARGRDTLAALLSEETHCEPFSSSPVLDGLMQRLKTLRPASPRSVPQGAAMITVSCGSCQKKLAVKDTLAGKKIKCPGCGQVVAVPAPVAAGPAVSADEYTLPPEPASAPAKAPAADSLSERPTHSQAGKLDTTLDSKAPASGHDPSLTEFLAPSQADDELGRLGKYRILKVLGFGGMGVVYKAEDPLLKRAVAVKAMLPGLAASASAGQRFLREAQAMAAVEHDHIVRVYQVDEDRGVPFLAMEFLKGEPLDVRLQREQTLPIREVVRIGKEIAEGLAAAHERGLIHRDIKPGNVWLEAPGGRVKILDFGLARSAEQKATLTQQGAIVGTPAYMAPEQGRGDAVGPRCDLFSLGCVLYQLCTGELPFQGRDTISTLMAVATTNPPPPRQLNAAVPSQLSDLVMKLLEKDPLQRMGSAAEVVQALQTIENKLAMKKRSEDKTDAITDGGIRPGEPSPGKTRVKKGKQPARSRGPARPLIAVAVAVFALLGLLAAGGIYYIVTDKGTIEITTEDENVQVVILKNGKEVEIVNPRTKKTWLLDTGAYTLKLKDDPDGFEIALPADQKFDLKRGDTVAVSIRRKHPVLPAEPGWVPLFNCKDLTGWGRVGGGSGNWKVVDGAITCSGPTDHLYTDRADFGDFHLRAEARINARGNSGIYFRAHKPVTFIGDYEAQITLNPDQRQKTGSLYGLVPIEESPVPADTWFTYEILATGNRIRLLVNGKETADYTEIRPDRLLRGNIVLQHHDEVTQVSFRKIEIKQLTKPGDVQLPAKEKVGEVRLTQPSPGWARSVAFSPDGRLVACGTEDGQVVLWDPWTDKQVARWTAHNGWVNSVAFTPDGKQILSGSEDKMVRLWDVETRKEVRRFDGHTAAVHCVAISPDGKRVLSGGADRTIRLWDLTTGKQLQCLTAHTHWVYCVTFSPNGRQALSGSADKTMRLWDLEKGTTLHVFQYGMGYVMSVAFLPDGKRGVCVSHDSLIHLWDLEAGRELMRAPAGASNCLAVSPDGKRVVAGNHQKELILWAVDGTTLRELTRFTGHGEVIDGVAYAPDGSHVVSGSRDKTLRLWRLPDAPAPKNQPAPGP